MRIIAPAAIDAVAKGEAISSGALRVATTTPFLAWSGYGTITLDGDTYTGIGNRAMINQSAAALGDSEQNISLSLSGVDPDVVPLIDQAGLKDAPVLFYRLIFDGTGRTLLDAQPHQRGRLDTLPVDEQIGGPSVITANIETSARGLGRSLQRMRTDADMRMVDAADGGFAKVSYSGEKSLYWGGVRPAGAGASLPGSQYSGGPGNPDWAYVNAL